MASGPNETLPTGNRRRSSHWETLAAGALPGALGGTHLAGLLFFLNPHLPFTVATAGRAVAFYATLLGLVSLLVHLPVTWRSRQRARGLLPWGLTLVLAATGVGAFVHASRFAFFLPPGMNRRLVKLGVVVTASAVVVFYTALLHRIRRRPYGRGSRLLLALLALLSVYSAFERREAFHPPHASAPRATVVEQGQRPKLLVVGIDTATLDAILPLAEVGRLPFFARLSEQGAYARLRSLRPPVRGALWTSIATGTFPYKHDYLGTRVYRAPFTDIGLRRLPLGIRFGLWGTLGARATELRGTLRRLTLPEILERLGLRVAAVGWPGEVSPSSGVSIVLPERFFVPGHAPSGAAVPEDLQERARLFEPRLEELAADAVARFGDAPPAALISSLRDDRWRSDLCRFLLEQEARVEALFLVLPGLEQLSLRAFGGYDAVRFHGAHGPRETRAAQLFSAYYEALDTIVANLWSLLPEPRLLLVVSAYGVDNPSRGRRLLGGMTGHPALYGRTAKAPDGVLMMLGDGIRAEMVTGRPTLVDVTPTVLYALGFPVANDMDGVVLTRAFDAGFLARRALSFVPSYEALAKPKANTAR